MDLNNDQVDRWHRERRREGLLDMDEDEYTAEWDWWSVILWSDCERRRRRGAQSGTHN